MPFIPPTAADLKARYPEFANVVDARIALVLDEIAPDVGEAWIEGHRKPAMLALAAHLLAVEGALSNNQTVGASLPGAVVREKVGDVEVQYSDPGKSSQGGAGSNGDPYASTIYGLRFIEYRRKSFPSVLTV